MSQPPRHIPVLASTILEILSPVRRETVIDVTLGLGGHASMFAEAIGTSGQLYALETDAANLVVARERLSSYPEVTFVHENFRALPELGLPPCDILFGDLGLSSPHIDDPSRGFSFRAEAPLDMRFDRERGMTAAERIAASSEDDITLVLQKYGELQGSRHLARIICEHPPTTTSELVTATEKAFGWRAKYVLAQIFQAFRVWVNDELGALEILLAFGPTLLKPGGRMGIISYHSLEDRLTKHAFRSLAQPTKDPVTGAVAVAAPFDLLTRKAVRPSETEIAENPRSRSAVFRAIRRVPS